MYPSDFLCKFLATCISTFFGMLMNRKTLVPIFQSNFNGILSSFYLEEYIFEKYDILKTSRPKSAAL